MKNIKINVKNITLFSLLFFLLLFFKRWNQLLDPEIWIEDGKYGIPTFLHYGWHDLLMDEGGFLKTINVLITNTGMTISPLYYPEVSTYLAWMFSILVSLAVVFSPTKLRYKPLAAILIYFIPTGLENFGIPYYSYFWSGILLFLALLWEPGKNLYLRLFYILLGGLSSPMVFMLLPLQIFRVIFINKFKKQEIVSLIVVAVVFTIQYKVFLIDGYTGSELSTNLDFLLTYIRKFYGLYYLNYISNGNLLIQTIGGAFVLLLFFIYWLQNIKDKYFYIVMALLLGTGLSAILRKYIQIDPISPGSRYYFYPYIMLAWSLLYITGAKQQWYRYFTIPILIMSIIVSFYNPYRTHAKLSYKKYLIACSNPKNHLNIIPEHLDGGKNGIYPWGFKLTSKECKQLLAKDFFSMPENLKVLQNNIHTLKKVKLPQSIEYNISLKDTQNKYKKPFKFTDQQPQTVSSKPLILLKELDLMHYKIKGNIKSNNKIATLFIKIGKQIIFIDENLDSKGKNIKIDDELVFSDYKENTPKELDNKKSTIKLCAINKKGTGYYELFNLPILITDIKSIFHSTKKEYKGFKFSIDKFDQIDDQLRIVGWFTELDHNLPTSLIKTPTLIQIDNKLYLTNQRYRSDVAAGLKNEKYRYSGFSLYVPIKELSEGTHTIKIYGLSFDRKRFLTPNKEWKFQSDKKHIFNTPQEFQKI